MKNFLNHNSADDQSGKLSQDYQLIETKDKNSNTKSRGKDSWLSALSTVAILLAAPLIAIIITTFVFQSYQVDGSSMESTLQDGDRLIVWKADKTWARITGSSYTPNRGDIVIFSTPALASVGQDPSKRLIKRVIGLPGERVVVHNEAITVYNKQHPKGFQPDKTLPYGKDIPDTPGDIDITIPQGKIFVCGDNRGNSLDSRYIGAVDTKGVVGKLVLRLFPLDKVSRF